LLKGAASISPALPFPVLPLAMVFGLRLCLAPVVLVDQRLNVLGAG
jgi:hypothetical protein